MSPAEQYVIDERRQRNRDCDKLIEGWKVLYKNICSGTMAYSYLKEHNPNVVKEIDETVSEVFEA